MALLWIEGFEGYGTTTGVTLGVLPRRGWTQESNTYFQLTPGRTGGFSGTDGRNYNYSTYIITPSLTTNDTIIIGVAFFNTYSFFTPSIRLYDGSTLGVNVTFSTSTGVITVKRGSTTLGTFTQGFSTNHWYYAEIKVKCHGTAGTVEVRIDGIAVMALGPINTQAGSHAYHDCVMLYFGAGYTYVRWDDMYVCDSTGAYSNDFQGVCKVVGIFPASDSDTAQWTTSAGSDHWALVDENPDNDDTDYVTSSTQGQTDLYHYQSVSGDGSIVGAQVNTTCRVASGTSFIIKEPIKSNGAV